MIGNVNVDWLVGFSHSAELLLAAQVLPPFEDELVVVAALRGSTTLFGTAILIIDSILPIIFDSAVAIRGPSLTIFAACTLSMFGEANRLPIVRGEDQASGGRCKTIESGVLSSRKGRLVVRLR